tara:strand:- start:245 stop:577 length:333 start_codon:yes stop_codon:yes gene_type:complete
MYSIRNVFFLFIILSPFLAYGNLESLSNDLSLKALKESEKDIDTAMLLSQQSVVADPKNAKAWAIAGKIYLLNKDLSSAERFYAKAREIDPFLKDVKDLESLIDNEKKEE